LCLDDLIEHYSFNPTCQGSVPQAIYLALLGPDFKTVMINCMKIGGDTDTVACMAGEIAYHLYGAPEEYIKRACRILQRDGEILLDNVNSFYARFTDIKLPDINCQIPKKKGNWLTRKFT
jgi:ADP-ribosylglycohydrolase